MALSPYIFRKKRGDFFHTFNWVMIDTYKNNPVFFKEITVYLANFKFQKKACQSTIFHRIYIFC